MRLFENVNGLLVEVDPKIAEATKAGRRVHQVNMTVHILFTNQEEKERDEEEARELEAQRQRQAELSSLTLEQKLVKLGLTSEDLKALLK
jgi:hypothetical protein